MTVLMVTGHFLACVRSIFPSVRPNEHLQESCPEANLRGCTIEDRRDKGAVFSLRHP